MKHKISAIEKLGQSEIKLEVELIPERKEEYEAILRVETMNANETERELVENYLLFQIGPSYSILKVLQQHGVYFTLKASQV